MWDIQAVFDLLVICSVGFALWFLYELRSVFTPVLVALGLAYVCNPLITAAETRWRTPRPLTITLLLVLFALGGVAFLAWLGPLLAEQAQTLARKTPHYLDTIGERYGIAFEGLSNQLSGLTAQVRDDPLAVFQPIFSGTGQALGLLGAFIGTTSYVAMTALLLPIYFFFFAWRFEDITATVRRLIPSSRRARALEIIQKIDEAVMGFFRGRLLIAVITGIMYAVGWAWTGVPYWFLLGAATGLLSIVPYVSVIGWPLAVLLKYLDVAAGAGVQSVDWISIAVLPSLSYLVVQFLESWWLTPWIQGRANDLSAVTVIIVVLVGGALGGILGLTLSIPIAASVKILFQELLLPRWKRWLAD